MTYMLCRNRVSDFERWKSVFTSHKNAHREAGLHLSRIWRCVEDPDNVFFVFEVSSLEKARAFINSANAAEAGAESGVVEGEYHFVEDAEGY